MVFSWDRDVPPEESEVIMNKIARSVVEYGMELPTILALELASPFGSAGAELIKIMFFPFLGLIGEDSYKLINTLRGRANLHKLIDRIRNLSEKDL